MRVLISTGPIAGLTSARAGACLARAWAEFGARLAVLPIAEAGGGFGQAWADLTGARPLAGGPVDGALHGWCGPAGVVVSPLPGVHDAAHAARLVCDAVTATAGQGDGPDEVWLEAPGSQWPGGVEAFWAALTPVREHLDRMRLHLVTSTAEQALHLTGFRGITAAHGRATGMHPGDMLAADQRLVDWCTSTADEGLGTTAGAGAAGGLGAAVLALGGDVVTGPGECARLGLLAQSVAAADLVVTGCDELDFGSKGGDLLPTVVDEANRAGRPAVAVARRNSISARELRTMGIEQAFDLEVDASGDAAAVGECLQREATRVARAWTW